VYYLLERFGLGVCREVKRETQMLRLIWQIILMRVQLAGLDFSRRHNINYIDLRRVRLD